MQQVPLWTILGAVSLASSSLWAGSAADSAFARLLADGFPQQPAPLSYQERQQIVSTLPATGEAELDLRSRGKVEALRTIHEAFGRSGIVTLRVVNLTHACAALYERTVLILSEATVRILTAEELEAVAAHELAHEYYWSEYYRARNQGDWDGVQVIELLADAVAVRVLRSLGRNPDTLKSAIVKINQYNEARHLPLDRTQHRSQRDRARFISAIAKMFLEHPTREQKRQ